MHRTRRSTFAAAASLVALSLAAPAVAQDAERATHGDRAATPQITLDARHGELTVRQYQLGCLSQLTYLLVSGDAAVVVDPQRDVDHYIEDARALGAKIRFVALTHTNADFVAGHTELSARTGAQIAISAESGSQFAHRGVRDGERLAFGSSSLEFWATPGHTLDSMTILVRDAAASAPLYALTGDSLFIGSIGRPDLASGVISPMALADRSFDSVQRFKQLPDATIVLPAHGAGSLCGAHLSPETTSTIAREKQTNPYFAITSRSAFVARDVSGLPPAPPYFAHNVALNRRGPPVVDWTVELPPALAPAEVARALADGAWAVDVREAHEYAKAHLAGAINIAIRGRLDTWTGSVIPFDAPMLLVGSDEEVRAAVFRFRRIGLDAVRGFLAGGIDAARTAGLELRSTPLISPATLAKQIAEGTEPIVVDVRTSDEHDELRLGDYAHIALTDWRQFDTLLDKQRPLLFLCNSAYRSSMAVGLAERLGFTQVQSLDGGLDAWLAAGLPVLGHAPVAAASAFVPKPAAKADVGSASTAPLLLPERIEAAALAVELLDQPASWTLIDVRAASQFAEFHVPGATNVAAQDVAATVAKLPRGARIVLVDRDGTLAFAVAGAVAAQLGANAPNLRVLSGGTAQWWRDIEIKSGAPRAMEVSTNPATPPPSAPVKVKPRSAGC